MPARSEFALRDATKPVPSGEKLTEDKVGGGNGWMRDSTVNVCPWGYTTWYSDLDAPLNVILTLTGPSLTVVAVPTDAYKGSNAEVEVNEKLPGMRLLMAPAPLVLMAMTSPCDGSASIVTCTAFMALEPSYREFRLIATVIVLQQSVVSAVLALRAVASDAKVPKVLCERQ